MSLDLERSGWKRVALGDVVRHVTDRVDPDASGLQYFLAGEHIPSGSLAIVDRGVIGRDPIGPMFYKRFRPGHVLYVSRRTYLRKVAVPEFEGITGEKTFVLESVDNDVLLQDFLPFVLSTERFHDYAIRNSRGSVNPYLNWGELAAYEFELPPADDQRRMAELLWALEFHERSVMNELAHLETAQSVWFDSKVAAGRWPVRSVSDLVVAGPTNGKSAPANDQGRGVPTLSISAIRGGRVLGGGSVKYMEVEPGNVAGFVIEEDDFLVVRGNGNKRLTGRGGLATGGLPAGCVFPDLLIRLRFDTGRLLPAFAAAQWNSTRAHSALVRKAKSTNGIWKINGKDVKTHELVVPPIEDQIDLLARLGTFEAAAAASRNEVELLARLRLTTLTQMLGGEQ